MRTDLGNRQCSGNLAGVKRDYYISTVALLDTCSYIELNTDLTMYLAQSRCSTNVLAMHTPSCMDSGFRTLCQNNCIQRCRGEYFGPHIISHLRDEENGLGAKVGKLFLPECELDFSSA